MIAIVLGGPRLLQCGDIVRVCGQRGVVTGVELRNRGIDIDNKHGPLFIIELADGTTTTAQTRAAEVLETSPASGPLSDEESVPCR